MPLSYSTGNANGSITTTNPDTFDMQRVEVLRGPQGTLYGAGAEGGLLKYVTNKPVFNKLQAGVEVGGMTVNHGQSVADGKAFLNVPVSDTFALRASGFYEDLPGWISNAATGEKYANRGFRYGARVTALWEPTKDLKVTAQAATQQLHSQGPNVVDLVGSALDPAAPPANQFALAHGLSLGAPTSNFSEGTEYYAYVNIDYDAHFARITSITSHGILGSTFKQDESGGEIAPGLTYGQFFGPGGPVPIYTVPVYNAQANPTRLYKTTQELRVSSEPGFQLGVTPVEWQFGGMITRELTHWQQYADFFAVSDPNGPPLEPRGGYAELNAPYYEKAAFADATVHFAPEFDLEAGVRYSNIIQTSQIHLHCCVLFGPDAVLPALHTSQDHADWSVAPRLHFGKDTLLYARIASGFRAGGPELIIPNAPPGFPLSYKPDHTVNYELGLRTYLFDRAVSIDVAAYYITWTDVQVSSVFATAAGPFTVQGNAGKASSTGVEWNLSFVPTPGLTLGIVGDYDDAKLTADADGLGGKNGDPLSFVPDFVNTVNLDYHQKAFNDYEFYIGGTWTHTGHFYNDFVAPASAGLLGSRVQLPAYDTLAMQAGLRNGRFDYELYVHNLSDSRALLSYSNSGGFNFFGQGAILQPRTFGFRISYKY
jgi:outer membrane receptor protein involved in Fe transport